MRFDTKVMFGGMVGFVVGFWLYMNEVYAIRAGEFMVAAWGEYRPETLVALLTLSSMIFFGRASSRETRHVPGAITALLMILSVVAGLMAINSIGKIRARLHTEATQLRR